MKGAPLSKADITDEGTPFVLYGELYTTYSEVARSIKRRTDKVVEPQFYSRVGDVIMPTSGETPEDIATASCIMLPDVILAGDLLIYRTQEVDGRFVSFVVKNKVNKQISSVAQGKSVVHVRAEELSKIAISYPSDAEQQKILTMLELLEDKIAKQQELIEHLKKYKRGVLKAILEQRLRFKRPNGENYPQWESYNISEITDCLDRRRVPITSNERIRGAYPYYGANGIQDYVADYIFDGEFVLLAEDGGHFNDFATEPIAQYVSGKIWVNNHAHILQAKCNTHFLFYALVHKDIRNYINNPSRGKLNQEDMQGIVIDVPCKEEQERIVDFMLKIDQNIEAKLNTLNQLVDFKKGLLQQLFI